MIGGTRQCPDDQQRPSGHASEAVAQQMAQPSTDGVAGDGVTDRARDHKARSRGRALIRTGSNVDHKVTTASPAASAQGGRELVPPSHALAGPEHGGDQADRRARPLARRADSTARPARVRIRSRNPWVFARRRLFGW
jgi:hypothetical protein